MSSQTFEPFLNGLEPHVERLRMIIEPAIEQQGLELVQLLWIRNARSDIVRLAVDKRDQPDVVIGADGAPQERQWSTVSLEECALVSRTLSDLLDVEDNDGQLFARPYDLEVGSPGLDRPLTKLSHLTHSIGRRIRLKLTMPVDGSRNYSAKLTAVDAAQIHVVTDDGVDHAIDNTVISSAHIVFEFGGPTRKPAAWKKPEKKTSRRAAIGAKHV